MTTDKTIEEMNRAICHFMNIQGTDMFLSLNYKYHEDWNQLHIVWNKLWYDCSIVPMKHELEWSKIRGSKCARAILYGTIKEAHKEIYEAIVFYTTTKQKD